MDKQGLCTISIWKIDEVKYGFGENDKWFIDDI